MSVFERGTASESDAVDLPGFPVALRGYDRQQVDAFVQDLTSRLAGERRRAEQAERAMAQMRLEVASARDRPPPSFEHLGAEAAKVLEQAGNSAKLLIEEARGRGEAIVREAEGQATELIERAEQQATELDAEARQVMTLAAGERDRMLGDVATEAEQIRTRAEEDARSALEQAREATERTRQKAAAEQTAMEAETERLRQSRDRMLNYLTRIHADLGALLAEATIGEPEASTWSEAETSPPARRDDGREPPAERAESEQAESERAESEQAEDRAGSTRWGAGH